MKLGCTTAGYWIDIFLGEAKNKVTHLQGQKFLICEYGCQTCSDGTGILDILAPGFTKLLANRLGLAKQ